eukprot:CAMPEP_0178404068 /NCGR_PEP_ID=MMETSP0689_2-20121128/17690_1 /TAXON_ID=160604 /ORGANISM="Amphidinium massartii, Strain CS-259" /LENGTH=172 /DNA_ID=CAMNT_0020025035 /DNA_START=478 /DNA_END=996 /DNA_ORIENTATION=-
MAITTVAAIAANNALKAQDRVSSSSLLSCSDSSSPLSPDPPGPLVVDLDAAWRASQDTTTTLPSPTMSKLSACWPKSLPAALPNCPTSRIGGGKQKSKSALAATNCKKEAVPLLPSGVSATCSGTISATSRLMAVAVQLRTKVTKASEGRSVSTSWMVNSGDSGTITTMVTR